MELLQIKDLAFTYPSGGRPAVRDLNLTIERGSFTLLCGASGCGKTTLLRLLKKEEAPFGERTGEIMYDGIPLADLDERRSAAEIGLVSQNPDTQIVTDKVWHELAFGPESLGIDTATIRRRVGEMASYFGIEDWYHRDTDTLSGGQKQLLNLAGVMVMQPKILLLDEPTGQLDPIAAADFLATLQKLNRELGLTVLLVEHRLEEIFPLVDRVLTMEEGRIRFDGPPREVARDMRGHYLYAALPSAARIWAGVSDGEGMPPLTVREGREMLEAQVTQPAEPLPLKTSERHQETVLEAKGLWFRYEKDLPDVLRDVSLRVQKGEVFALLGGNGTGKSTLLNVLTGLDRPYKGRVIVKGKRIKDYKRGSLYRKNLALLPQDPSAVFLKKTVYKDFEDLLSLPTYASTDKEAAIREQAEHFGITHLLDRHPYDLSGGEQQLAALAKMMLTEPEILLLDEPTKGIDAFAKLRLMDLLRRLRESGKTVVMVTHDVEFAAAAADRCALFFDGSLIAEDGPRRFFSDNTFYTTAASRIARGRFPRAVLCEEVVSAWHAHADASGR